MLYSCNQIFKNFKILGTMFIRNLTMIGVDEDVLAFRFIRRIRIDQHLIGADIEIKAVGGTVTAYCLSKGDCRRIKQILMDYNATRLSKRTSSSAFGLQRGL